jgi:hypothetical protein
MAQGGAKGVFRYCCRSCGAALLVRVGFKGKLVWTVEDASGAFGETEPELRGDSQEPQIVCSADVMHATGFKLQDGAIAVDPKFSASPGRGG